VSAALLGTPAAAAGSIWHRTRRIWTVALMVFPVVLAGMSLVGYHYSANVLSYRFGWTLWIILAATSFVSLAQQIVLIILHKISLRRFWLSHTADEHSSGVAPDELDSDKVNFQIGRLLRGFTLAGVAVATYFLWAQVLPAIQILDRVELWTHQVAAAETLRRSDGGETTQMVTRLDTITLADLAWCAMLLVLTTVLSRNLPGLLEVTLLDRLPLDRGGKYAISLVCRYVVAIVGIVFACRILGFEWSSVQWLVAAMSVGLGFGLQEIFGNFVSGIIILLERPVRVGDLVTVNGTSGTVTRIQLRATTITDFDRREMIVPNKKFITDDVVNWTLTDPITRLVVPVGIAYGADTQLACQTLLEVARRNEDIMSDPEPTVVFVRFGASSLDLELRVFIAERSMASDAQHSLHMMIDQAFRERNIEIAFPQQDIHVRSIAPLASAIVSAREALSQQKKNTAA
jgi:potassium efflux system protein